MWASPPQSSFWRARDASRSRIEGLRIFQFARVAARRHLDVAGSPSNKIRDSTRGISNKPLLLTPKSSVKRCALVGGLAAQQNDETLESAGKSEQTAALAPLRSPPPERKRGARGARRRRGKGCPCHPSDDHHEVLGVVGIRGQGPVACVARQQEARGIIDVFLIHRTSFVGPGTCPVDHTFSARFLTSDCYCHGLPDRQRATRLAARAPC